MQIPVIAETYNATPNTFPLQLKEVHILRALQLNQVIMVQEDQITVALKATAVQVSLLQVRAQVMYVVPRQQVAVLPLADLMEAEVNPFQRKQQEQDNLNKSIL